MNSNLSALYANSRQVELARTTGQRCCNVARSATKAIAPRRHRLGLRRGQSAACCA